MSTLIFPLLAKIASLLLMVFAGVMLVKIGLLKKEDSLPLSKITVYLLSPCVIVSSFSIELSETAARNLLLCFFYAILANFLFLFMGRMLRRPLNLSPVEEMSVEYTNCGYFVLPLVASVFGDEYLLYVSAYITVFNLLIWTHGLQLFQGKKSGEKQYVKLFLKILLNPNILAIFFGAFLFFTKISLPHPLALAISDLGKMVGSISMLITGIALGGMQVKKIFLYKRIYLISFLRLFALPLCYLLLIKPFSVVDGFLDNPTLFLVTYLSAIAPSAASVAQFAILFGKDEEYASCINIFTTLLTVVSIPIMVFFSDKILT